MYRKRHRDRGPADSVGATTDAIGGRGGHFQLAAGGSYPTDSGALIAGDAEEGGVGGIGRLDGVGETGRGQRRRVAVIQSDGGEGGGGTRGGRAAEDKLPRIIGRRCDGADEDFINRRTNRRRGSDRPHSRGGGIGVGAYSGVTSCHKPILHPSSNDSELVISIGTAG